MSVNIGGRRYLSMSQPFGNADAVHAVEIQHGSHCVAERMGVDVGQPVADSELFQPVRDRIRVHGLSVVLSKHEVLIAVVFTQTEAFGSLPCPVFSQELHCFHWQGNEPFRPFRLRCAFINPDIGRIQNAVANVNPV